MHLIAIICSQGKSQCRKINDTNKMEIKHKRERTEENNTQGTRGQLQGV